MAKSKTNALGDDYTAGNAPFAQRDVTSRYVNVVGTVET